MTDKAIPMTTVPLLTTLSMAVGSSVDLFEVVRSSMCWQFGDEKSLALKAVLLRSPTEALLFVNDQTLANKMMSDPIIHLSGPLTASFSDGTGCSTEYICVRYAEGFSLNHAVRDIEALMRNLSDPPGFQHCTFFCHNSSITVHLPTPTQAKTMQTMLSTLPAIQSSTAVTAGDHACVGMTWRSTTPLSDVQARLRRSGISLLTVLQNILCLGSDQPCIIGVTVLPQLTFAASTASASSVDLVLICCTSEDAAVVQSRKTISLGDVGTLHTLQEGEQSITSAHLASVKEDKRTVGPPVMSMGSLLGGGGLRGILKSTSGSSDSKSAPVPLEKTAHGPTTTPSFSIPRSNCYVFWDMLACPLFHVSSASHEDDAGGVVENIETLMGCAMPKHDTIMLKASQTSNTVFVTSPHISTSSDTFQLDKTSECCSAKQLEVLREHNFKTVTCCEDGSAGSLSTSLQQAINRIVEMHRGERNKPAVCLIMHGTLYGGACEKLKGAGFTEALLVLHSMERRSVSSSSGHKYLPWDVVRHYHDLSDKEKKVVSSFSGDYNGIERLRKWKTKENQWMQQHSDDAISSVSTGMSIASGNGFEWSGGEKGPQQPQSFGTIGSGSNGSNLVVKTGSSVFPYSKTIKVSRFSMACHVNNLLKWKEDESATGIIPEGAQPIDEIFARCVGEPGKQTSSRGGSSAQQLSLSRVEIEVCIDREKRRQKIEVRGETEEVVRDKAEQVEHMIGLMNATRRVLRMHDWKRQHREALMGSVPLNQMMQQCRASVVFHSTDGFIVSEMMALSEDSINMMADYLRALEPGEATWSFPHKHLEPEPRVRFWNSIRNRYGVMFEKKQKRDRLEVNAWGFGSLINDAYADIRSASMGNIVTYTSPAVISPGLGNKAAGGSLLAGKSPPLVPRESSSLSSASSHLPLLMPPPTTSLATRHDGKLQHARGPASVSFASVLSSGDSGGSSGIHAITYHFLDKDAAQFYRTYDEMFQLYLKHKYKVLVSLLAPSSPPTTAIGTIREEEEESPLLGSAPAEAVGMADNTAREGIVMLDMRGTESGLAAAQSYLNDLSSKLNCYEIEFAAVDKSLYQDIVNLQEDATRAFVQDANRTASMNENPLDCPGLISIRLKPPLHPQGMSHMLFPVPHAGIYMCESIKTAELHGHGHRPSPKMQRIFTRFRNLLDSHQHLKDHRDGVCERKSADDSRRPDLTSGGDRRPFHGSGLASIGYSSLVIEPPTSSSSSGRGSSDEEFHRDPGSSVISADVLEWLSGISSMSPATHHTAPSLQQPYDYDYHFEYSSHGSSLPSSVASDFTDSSMYPTPPRPSQANPPSTVGAAAAPSPRKTYTEVLRGGPSNEMPAHPPHQRGPPASAGSSTSGRDAKSWWRPDPSGPAYTSDTDGNESLCSGITMTTGSDWIVSSASNPQQRSTVHWPHSSFRYMFLSERMKEYIRETVAAIQQLPGGASVKVTCPYRDKKDASVCMLLEGPAEAVEEGVAMFDNMLQRVRGMLRNEKVLLTSRQYEELSSSDLAKVKAIQGSAGVHIVLSPMDADLRAASVTHDFRNIHAQQKPIDEEKLLVRLWKHRLELSVMTTPVEAEEWAWRVDALFAVLETGEDAQLTAQEISKLARGEVLVSTDEGSGRSVLRARPIFPPTTTSPDAESSTQQAEKLLRHLLSRALEAADRLGLQSIAIVPPDTVPEFARSGGLSEVRIKNLTVAHVVEHILRSPVQSLKRIVLLDVLRNGTAGGDGNYSTVSRHNTMAEELCRLTMGLPEVTISKCNDDICRKLLGKQAPHTPTPSTSGGVDKGSMHQVLLKGTQDCLDTAVQEIKDAVSAV